ncbi:hypothetical protein Gotri_004656 [Gossypium trilobum]|uniref:Protein FAR1-RELATED SEQUENCE n=1 Tax=Gossypium trilobum TaxID=34281 RepID=A0A7J9F5I3_9ROSI|nr:hypothetical protein [Gossypium trilobum]
MDVGGGKGDNGRGVNIESSKGGGSSWNLIENSTGIDVVVNPNDDGGAGGKPCVGMEFESEDAGRTFYDGYARRLGFSTHVGQFTRTKLDGPIVVWDFACSREVLKRKNVESCNAMFRIERKDGKKWVATKFVEDHNHSMVNPSKVHYLRPRRHFAGATKNVPETSDAATDVWALVDGNHVSCEATRVGNTSCVDPNHLVRNMGSVGYVGLPSQRRTLGKDAPNLLNYFKKMQAENPGFYYAIQLDDDNRMTNVFWADARSRAAYNHFGDAVIFDTMYRPNQYQIPFAPFTGINHHGQMVLFGCALLLDESKSSFTWLFRTWLSAMNNRCPVSITTDQDRAIQAAVSQIYGCINFSETIEDFESSWTTLLDKYNLQKNEWLLAVYNARKQWAPVYFRGTFFASLSSNQGAANLYTKKVFSKFQEELVETFVYTANKIEGDGIVSKYRVAKYEHDDKAYFVMLNVSEMKASCTCQMFEYSGILCRHILTVFTVTNVLTLPSHYILRRWTKSAKSWVGLDEKNADPQGVETLTARFNILCQEAFKLAEEGSVVPETYSAAINALRDAVKKVAFIKKDVAKVTPPRSYINGNSHEDGSKKTTSPVSEMVPSLWPWQDAVSPRFNLIDSGAPLTDLNQSSMVPVSIDRDTDHLDSTVVLSCFKSMTWVIENKKEVEACKVAVINLKLHDYSKNPLGETEVQFRLTKVTLEPMLRSMAYISQQLSTPVNRVAAINLKLQDTKTTSGEKEVKFQVSKDTLGSMLRSMAYIREQL